MERAPAARWRADLFFRFDGQLIQVVRQNAFQLRDLAAREPVVFPKFGRPRPTVRIEHSRNHRLEEGVTIKCAILSAQPWIGLATDRGPHAGPKRFLRLFSIAGLLPGPPFGGLPEFLLASGSP